MFLDISLIYFRKCISNYEQIAVTVPGGWGVGPGTANYRKQAGAHVQKRWGVKFVPGGRGSIELPHSIH